jgi:tetratricopeptide (TPR) repeat protein
MLPPFIFICSAEDKDALSEIGIMDFFGPIVFTIMFVLIFVSLYFVSKKSFKNDKLIQKEHDYLFSADGIKISSVNSTLDVKWDELFKHIETKSSFFIYASPQKAFIIPKRLLSEIETLRTILEINIVSKEKNGLFTPGRILRILMYLTIPCIFLYFYFDKDQKPSLNKYMNDGYEKERKYDYQGAILYYSKAIKEDSMYSDAYTCRGRAKGMLRDYSGEILDCKKAIKLSNGNGMAYYYLGWAKHCMGDSTGCCMDLRKADSLGFHQAKKAIEQSCK